jgi:MFS transporter, PPP family, 3-phenylpropionic acid transporter
VIARRQVDAFDQTQAGERLQRPEDRCATDGLAVVAAGHEHILGGEMPFPTGDRPADRPTRVGDAQSRLPERGDDRVVVSHESIVDGDRWGRNLPTRLRGMEPVDRPAAARAIGAYIALFAAIGAVLPYLPVYYQSLGFGLDAIGLLAALFAAASIVGAAVWGAAADRFGVSRSVLAMAAAVGAVGAVALALIDGTLAIAAAAVVLAFGMAGVTPVLDARALEVVGDDRARYGRLRVWDSASFVVAVVVTGWLIGETSVHAMFAVLTAALIATALVGIGIHSKPAAPPLPRFGGLAAVAGSSLLLPFLAVVLLGWTAANAIDAFFSIHLAAIGAPASLVGVAWALGAAVEVPIMFAFPLLVRHVGLHRLLLVGALLFAVRAVAIVATRDPLIVALSMLLHGAAFAIVLVGGVIYVSRHAPRGAAATAQGVLAATVFGLAQVAGPGIGGIVAGSLGIQGMFALAGISSGMAVLALAWVLRNPGDHATVPVST